VLGVPVMNQAARYQIHGSIDKACSGSSEDAAAASANPCDRRQLAPARATPARSSRTRRSSSTKGAACSCASRNRCRPVENLPACLVFITHEHRSFGSLRPGRQLASSPGHVATIELGADPLARPLLCFLAPEHLKTLGVVVLVKTSRARSAPERRLERGVDGQPPARWSSGCCRRRPTTLRAQHGAG